METLFQLKPVEKKSIIKHSFIEELTQENIEKIRAAFDKFDKTNSGFVNLFELVFIFNGEIHLNDND